MPTKTLMTDKEIIDELAKRLYGTNFDVKDCDELSTNTVKASELFNVVKQNLRSDKNEYSRGYGAGKKHEKDKLATQKALHDHEVRQLKQKLKELQLNQSASQRERVYLKNFELALQNCSHWTIGEEKIHNVDGYTQLAEIMTDNALGIINK